MPKLTVGDVMTEEPIALEPDASLAVVHELMEEKHFRHMPIVDGDGDLVGLVSHRDLVKGTLDVESDLPLTNQRDLFRSIKAREVMTTEVESVGRDTSLRDAAQLIFENKFGCLPVVENQRLVGILTEADFVKHVMNSEA